MQAPSTSAPERPTLNVQIVLLGGSMFTLLAGASIAPALPAIKAQFIEHPQADILSKLVLSLTALCIALGAPLAGWAVDRFGRRRPLILSILGTGVGGTAGYFAWSLESLLATRAILGLSVAVTMTAVTALIADYFDGTDRRRFLGLQSAAMKVGGICFLLMGGWLATHGWREPFLVDLLAFLILPGAIFALRESATGRAGPQAPSPGHRPEIDGGTRKAMLAVCAAAALTQVSFYMLPTQLPFLATQQLGLGPRDIAVGLATNALVAALAASQYRRIRGALGLGGCLALLFGLMALGHGLIAGAASSASMLLALMISGLGVGLVVPTMSGWALDLVPETHRGRASGWLTSSLFTGQFVSPLIWQPVVVQQGVRSAFVVAAVVLACCAAVAAAWALRERRALASGHRNPEQRPAP